MEETKDGEVKMNTALFQAILKKKVLREILARDACLTQRAAEKG
jgi:hypothetical protein